MDSSAPEILLTNDDGIESPGLWAAAEALSELGFVHVVAPREQSSGTGRSMPSTSDGVIRPQELHIRGKNWTVYAIGGTPAQAVQHAILEILSRRPDLVVAGINYGENLGTGVTISGTIGAALEAAAFEIPSLAVSLETENHYHLSYSREIDFSTAAHFTGLMARLLLERQMPPDVDVLKVDIPGDATPETPWVLTRLSRHRYYESIPPQRKSWSEAGWIGYRLAQNRDQFPEGTDAHALAIQRVVSVTPLSLDMTSRIHLGELDSLLRRSL